MKIELLGATIKRRRMALGIDQRTLGRIAGVAVHTLSNIESGKGNPTIASLERILNALGMELSTRLKEE